MRERPGFVGSGADIIWRLMEGSRGTKAAAEATVSDARDKARKTMLQGKATGV